MSMTRAPERSQCAATTYRGQPCKLRAQADADHCSVHEPSRRRGSMTPSEAVAYMREHHMDAIRAVVAEAPPPPVDAIEMLRALGFPFRRAAGVVDVDPENKA